MKTKSILSLLSVIASIAAAPIFGAQAASYSTPGGDASFRRITALGGKLSGVDLTNSLITIAGQQHLLGSIAALAASGLPASLANTPGGWVELDSNGLIPTSLLPAASSSGSSLSAASLGTANGPAALDANSSLSTNLAEATNATVQRTLAAHFADTVNAADFGMKCDGATDDTQALAFTLRIAAGRTTGAEVDLPSGRCMLSAELDVTDAYGLKITGRGVQSTQLVWTGASNGLVVTVNGGSSSTGAPGLTVADLQLTKISGANGGSTVHVGTALTVTTPNFTDAGQLVLFNLVAQPPVERQSADSWNRGFNIGPFAHADIVDVQSFMGPAIYASADVFPDISQTATIASPKAAPVAMPSDAGWGVQCGFCIEGSASAGAYVADVHLVNVTTTGGISGVDVGEEVQGVYVVNSVIAYGLYGVRWGDPDHAGDAELAVVTGSHLNNTLANIYLDSVHEEIVTGNFLYTAKTQIWLRDGALPAITGNQMTIGTNGVFVSDDGSGYAGTPGTVTGNGAWGLSGICFGNDKNTSALSVSSNATASCGTTISDGSEDQSGYMHNNYVANVLNGTASAEQQADNSWWLPGTLRVGKAYSNGEFYLEHSNGSSITPFGLWDGATGNLSTAGSMTLTGTAAHSVTENVFSASGGSGGATLTLTPASGYGAFPTFSGIATLSGEVTCANATLQMSWRVLGHYSESGTTLTAKGFTILVESDADTQNAVGPSGQATGTSAVALALSTSTVGIAVTFGSGTTSNYSCTADLKQMTSN